MQSGMTEQKSFQELTGRNTQENLSEFIKSMILQSTKALHGHSLALITFSFDSTYFTYKLNEINLDT